MLANTMDSMVSKDSLENSSMMMDYKLDLLVSNWDSMVSTLDLLASMMDSLVSKQD